MFGLANRRTRVRPKICSKSRLTFESLETKAMLSAAPPSVADVSIASTDWSQSFTDYLQTNSFGDAGYSIPTGSAAQTAPLPWNNLNQVVITFSEDVLIDASDLSLSGVNVASYKFADFYYDAFSHVATWTLDNYIGADRLMIDLDADGLDPVTDLTGNILDGEWTDNVSSGNSGDAAAGGDFEFSFNVLPGDTDQMGLVNIFDYVYTRILTGRDTADPHYEIYHDIDGSGLIDTTDWMDILGLQGTGLPVGQPLGVSNDAPTTAGIGLVDIDDDAIDVAISLFDAFEDAEDNDSQMTFSVTGNTDPGLLDTVSIDSSTGDLTLSSAPGVSGRTNLRIQATDSTGLTVETTVAVDVDRDNLPPSIDNFWSQEATGNTYLFSGYVSDPDDDVEDLIVTFTGVINVRASVDENGYFEFALILDENDIGFIYAQTVDPHGLLSNVDSEWVPIT